MQEQCTGQEHPEVEALQRRSRALMTHIPIKSQHNLSQPVYEALREGLGFVDSPGQTEPTPAIDSDDQESYSSRYSQSLRAEAQDNEGKKSNMLVILASIGGLHLSHNLSLCCANISSSSCFLSYKAES